MRSMYRGLLLAVLMALAISASVAQAASATTIQPLNTEFTARSTNLAWTFPNKALSECETTTATGITPAKEHEGGPIPVSLKFSKCTMFGGVKATVVVECTAGNSNTLTLSYGSPIQSTLTLSNGCKIVMAISTCKLTITGNQAFAGTWVNQTFPALSLDTLTKASFTVTSTGGICGESGTGTVSARFAAETANKLATVTVKE